MKAAQKKAKQAVMRNEPARILHQGVAVQPLIDQLEAQPDLWDRNVVNTMGLEGRCVSDIIVRSNDWNNWRGDRAKFSERHESVWWAAYERLPYVKPLVFDLMRLFEAEALGAVVITRIAAGGKVLRHFDAGWHAQHYLKFAVQIKAAPGQNLCYEDFELETQVGDLYAFDNSKPHWITNPTDEERWTLIVCLRLAQSHCLACDWAGPDAH